METLIYVHTIYSSSQYLERFQVDLLHCQPAIFCEELHKREKQNYDQKTDVRGTTLLPLPVRSRNNTNLQMLQVVLLYVLREIVHLKTKIYKVRHKC